ncbi:restriction endonuclease subunit S [Stutzerimonas nitrititolerans]|uniref:restriction endonuclease subunit S n=1 Tax=Stutzerimonas nitrititolerans TaxID=2482751 RepID=UPI0020294029|nr:restriction endonuclease subunit S [Stutzerimonas nitrititolerans]
MNNGAAVGPQGEGRESPSSFPKYPAYKSSGVEWLGEVPEHWAVIALKWLSPVFRGASPRPIDDPIYFDDDGEFGWVRIADVTASPDGYLYETTQRLSALGSSLSVKLEPGELFLSIAGSVGKPCITAVKACIHDGFVYFPWLSIDQRLLYRVFESGLCFGGLGKMGTQLNLNTDTVGGICIAVPPAAELSRALAFLDHETARIDALIEEQQRLIELLKEKRQAVISHAVTKGLDPTVPMKDSGVEWLGEVPEHWESLTLGRVASSVKTGGTPSDDLPSADIIDGVEWYTPGDFTGDLLLDSSEKRVSAGAVRSGNAKVFPSGSVLIVSIGATLGKVGHIRRPASANQQINAVVPGPRVDGYFLAYSLSVKVNAMRFLSNASTIGIMNQEKTKEIWLSLPPLQEQKLITEFLDKQTSVIDTLIQEAAGGVALLQERRSALISAAVTGKIDVRGWQPPASAQAPELAKEAV